MLRKYFSQICMLLCLFFMFSSKCDSARALYLDLMKKILVNSIYQDQSIDNPKTGLNPYDEKLRESGRDWPSQAHTMVGLKRLNNIHYCIEEIYKDGVPGDFIETGVWRGGSTVLMRAIIKAHDDSTRRVWVADSFVGLPKPNIAEYPDDKGLNLYQFNTILAVSLETVRENFRRYGLLDEQVCFLKGWFKDTLPNAPIEKIALLRLDGDLYESTWDALSNLYPKLSVGGFVIIDDYQIDACRKAVTDFRKQHTITDKIINIDGFGVFWRRLH